jgi:large subunit ribosomal protein L5
MMAAKSDKAEKPDKAAKAAKAPKQVKGKQAKDKAEKVPAGPPPTPRLMQRYRDEILPALAERLGRKNRLSLPRLEKIVINMGVGDAIQEKKYLEEATDALRWISGQKPVITTARKSIAGFKLREGMAIGCRVTLRGLRMWEFLDRLISLALPRVRDFRGLSPAAFDGHGNYSIGLSEQLVFPELNPDKYTRQQGMNVTLVTSTDSDDEARELLRQLGMPLRAA